MMELTQQVQAMQEATLAMNAKVLEIRRLVQQQDWHDVATTLGELSGMAFAVAEATRMALLNLPPVQPRRGH